MFVKLFAKRIIELWGIFLLVIIFGFTEKQPVVINPATADCYQGLEKISGYYKANYFKDKIYFKLYTQTVENGEAGEKLETQIWRNADRIKYENPFVRILQDGQTQVTVLKDQKLIIIKKVKKNENDVNFSKWLNTPVSEQLDSLKKMTSGISCNKSGEKGSIVMDFPKDMNNKKKTFKQITLEFRSSTGELKKGEYEYYTVSGTMKDIYEYAVVSDKFDNTILEGSALSKVMNGDKLKKEYAGFKVKNLQ